MVKDTYPTRHPPLEFTAMTLSPAVRLRPAALFAALAAAVVVVEWLIIRRPDFGTRPLLPAAVTFDLLALLPLLFYKLVVRPYRLPVSSVIGAFVGAVALGSYLLPVAQQQYLGWASRSLAGLEVLTLTLTLLNLRRLRRAYLGARTTETDVVNCLSAAFQAVFQRAMAPLVMEFSVLYYALLSWKAAPEAAETDQAFTSYRESAFTAYLGTVGLLSVAEMGALHLLLVRWSATAAWVGLGLHLYGLLMLLAHIRAVRLRPVLIKPTGELVLRTGFFWCLRLPAGAVLRCEPLTDAPTSTKGLLNLARPLLTPPNLLLTLREPQLATGPYGLRRSVQQVALYLDQPTGFGRALGLG